MEFVFDLTPVIDLPVKIIITANSKKDSLKILELIIGKEILGNYLLQENEKKYHG